MFPPTVLKRASQAVSTVAALAEIPEEDIRLAKQKSKCARRVYKQHVRHFLRTLTIRSYEELRQVDHRPLIAWERIMRKIEEAARSGAGTPCFPAFSSTWPATVTPRKIPFSKSSARPSNREGSTLAFSKADATELLDKPDESTFEGLRDRAVLAVGLRVGIHRSLHAGDIHHDSARNGCSLADVQSAADTGSLARPNYDRRGYNLGKWASFFAMY